MNTQTQHTPGPWTVANVAIVARPVRVAEHFAIRPQSRIDVQEANARLIAAAPEMAAKIIKLEADKAELLAALRSALNTIIHPGNLNSIEGVEAKERSIAKARAAIAKAQGKE